MLHCVANTPIPCNAKERERCGKGHVSFTVLGIKNVGWAYAPWKKPKANAKSVKDASAKPLFEQVSAPPTFAPPSLPYNPYSIGRSAWKSLEVSG